MDDVYDEEVEAHWCVHCFSSPCLLRQGLSKSIMAYYEQGLCDEDGEPMFPTKQIRYHLYKHVTASVHGFLGSGVRIRIPVCVRGEILDLAPDPDPEYVVFLEVGESSDTNTAHDLDNNLEDHNPQPKKRVKAGADSSSTTSTSTI